MSARTKGILNLLLAAVFLSLALTLVRAAGDLPSVQKMFFRNIIMAIGTFTVMKKEQIPVRIEKQYALRLLLRGMSGGMSMICNFYAIDHMNLADSAMLNKLAPFFTVVFSWLFLKERARASGLIALVVAFVGALFIIKPTGNNMEMLPALIGTLGGIFGGLSFTAVRAASQAGAHQKMIVLTLSVTSCIMVFPSMIINFVPMTLQQMMILFICGLLSIAGHFCNTRAFSIAPASEISVFDYTQVLFSALYGFILFGQIPDRFSLIGYIIIIGTGVMVFFDNRKQPIKEAK